jgi:hypothetical protein
LQTDLHYTPSQIRELTLEEVNRVFNYWRKYPPLRDLVAAFVGFKPKSDEDAEPKKMTADDMRLLMQSTGGKIPGIGRM